MILADFLFRSGTHPFELPDGLAAVWRGAYFVGAACTLGVMWTFMRYPGMPRSRRIFMVALALTVLRTVIVNIERWDSPMFAEGLPVDTAILIFAAIALRRWYKEHRV